MSENCLESDTCAKQHTDGSILELACIVQNVIATAHSKAQPIGFDPFEVLGGITAQCIQGLSELVQDEATAIAFFREIVANWEQESCRNISERVTVPVSFLVH